VATRCGLEMEEFGEWSPDDAVAMVANPQAKIDIVEHDPQAFVAAADLEENRSAQGQAGAGDSRDPTRECQLAGWAGIPVARETELVGCHHPWPEHDAGVLYPPVCIEQLGADGANVRA